MSNIDKATRSMTLQGAASMDEIRAYRAANAAMSEADAMFNRAAQTEAHEAMWSLGDFVGRAAGCFR